MSLSEDMDLIIKIFESNNLCINDSTLVQSDYHEYKKPLLITATDGNKYIYKKGCGDFFGLMSRWYFDFIDFKGYNTLLFNDKKTFIRKWIHADQLIYDPESYFYKFGALLTFAYVFNIVDVHLENLIISNQSPIPIDIECMFYPYYNHSMSHFPECTGLIEDKGKSNKSLSALTGGGVYSEFSDPMNNFGEILIKRRKTIEDNIPLDSSGNKIDYKAYIKNILDGAEAYYKYALESKSDILHDVSRCKGFTRKIYCPTIFYRVLLSETLFTPYHKIKTLVANRFKRFRNFYRDQCLIQQETHDLLHLNTPAFYYDIHTGELLRPKTRNKPLSLSPPMNTFINKINHIKLNSITKFKERIFNILTSS